MWSRRREWLLALELLLPHLFLATGIQDPPVFQKLALSGKNVTLEISKLPDNYKQITWFYNNNQKIVEWESNEPNYFDSKFKNRVFLDQNYALWIYNVQKEDSSTYIMRVLTESGKEEEEKTLLEVFDPVPKPVIKIEKTQEVNNGCHLKLSCGIPDQPINYTWYGDLREFPIELRSNVLEITVNAQNHSNSYTCQVSNPMSRENDTVYFFLPCKIARSSGVAWIATWLVVMVPIVPGLLWT